MATIPLWPETPAITAYGGSQVKRVLCVGDSIMNAVDDVLQSRLATKGRTATVLREAVSASSACQWRKFWFTDILNAADADIVVAHFLGNEPGCDAGGWTQPGWQQENRDALLSMEAEAELAGVHFYAVVPLASHRMCIGNADSFVSSLWRSFARWQRTTLSRPIDARVVFGGDVYVPTFKFSNGAVGDVRTPDCVHLTSLGYNYLADVVISGIQGEWT